LCDNSFSNQHLSSCLNSKRESKEALGQGVIENNQKDKKGGAHLGKLFTIKQKENKKNRERGARSPFCQEQTETIENREGRTGQLTLTHTTTTFESKRGREGRNPRYLFSFSSSFSSKCYFFQSLTFS
jgi:hypothetical protein